MATVTGGINYQVFNDEPTLEDKISRKDLVKEIGDHIATCEPPHVFGIHGEWGCGKTSVMHLLQLYLTGKCPQNSQDNSECVMIARRLWGSDWVPKNDVTVVWFEAWRYQHEEAPIVALLQEIQAQLVWQLKFLKKTKKEIEIAIQSALIAFEGITKGIGIQASKIQQTGEKWEKEHFATILPSHAIRQQLERAINQLMGAGSAKKPSKRLVVLVDDLDRCESEPAYKLLEGIKIYLNLPNCVFVLGMNQEIIEAAVAKHLPETRVANGENHSNGSDSYNGSARVYLEKLCQSIYHLPLLQDPSGLLRDLLNDANVEPVVAVRIKSILSEYNCLPANSRKIKKCANTLLRFIDYLKYNQKSLIDIGDPALKRFQSIPESYIMSPEGMGELCLRLMIIMACLYVYHHEIYRRIETNPKFYFLMRDWALGSPSNHELLCGLQLMEEAEESPKEATPGGNMVDAHRDPVKENVFRLQSLIKDERTIVIEDMLRAFTLR